MIRAGRTRPTFAAELVWAWGHTDLPTLVGLAMRAHRHEVGASQREYAKRRGWSKSHQWRIESHVDDLRLKDIMAALEGTGYALALVDEGRDADETVSARQFSVTELIARDEGGRRFPACRSVVRTRYAPQWWVGRHASRGGWPPEWTAAP